MTLRVVLMGVSGCGKSSVGAALTPLLGVPNFDGNDLHLAANVKKMGSDAPLTDEDRWPWPDRVAQTSASRAPVIIGCSALRRVYRDRLRAGAGGAVRLVHLSGIHAVFAARSGHNMPEEKNLLAQFLRRRPDMIMATGGKHTPLVWQTAIPGM
jgi:gluconokinase